MNTQQNLALRAARPKRPVATLVERLEPRIAPAVVVNPSNPRQASYTDVDGDRVTISVDRGDLNNAVFSTTPGGLFGGEQLNLVDLTHSSFAGAKFTTKAVSQGGKGDGFAAVGAINADGRDLAAITIDGDLGALTVGDATASTPGLGLLKVHSLGAYDVATQMPAGTLVLAIAGAVGTINVKTDITNSFISITGLAPADRALNLLTIGGSIYGGGAVDSGRLEVEGTVGTINLRGSLVSSLGDHSGTLFMTGRLGTLTVRGSVVGGAGNNDDLNEEGQIRARFGFGKISITGDLASGTGSRTAFIFGGTDVGLPFVPETSSGNVTIGGSIISRADTGVGGIIGTNGNLGKLTVGKNILVSTNSTSTIAAVGTVASVSIGGSILVDDGGTCSIFGRVLGPVKIGGDVRAGASGIFNLAAAGNDVSSPGLSDAQANALAIAIKSINVRGSFIGALVYAGLAVSGDMQADVKVGPVKVGGDWMRSNVLVGAEVGPDVRIGTSDDFAPDGGGRSGVISSIASLTIGGQALGTAQDTMDRFGIIAQQVGRVTVGGTVIPLQPGPSNDRADATVELGSFNDLAIVEVL